MRRALLACLLVAACQREERKFSLPEATARPLSTQPASDFYAGEPPLMTADHLDPALPGYSESAYAVSEGAALYMAMNCVGCHANGGGAIGPALIDQKWLYGASPYAVAQTILGGRKNGMPSYRGKLGVQQLYYLVAYVRTLGGLVNGNAVPARLDDLRAAPSRNLDNHGWPFRPQVTP